jgi:DNA-binding response OmpR family regulator
MNCNAFAPIQALSSDNKNSSEPFKLNLRCRILVAEDDHVIRRLISLFLMDEDFEVEAVSDGEQAWDAINHGDYDLLVTDNEMPRFTGINLIRRIREVGIPLRIIMVSGTFSPETVHDYTDLQIAAAIPKPFGRLEIVNAVRNALFSPKDFVSNQVQQDINAMTR